MQLHYLARRLARCIRSGVSNAHFKEQEMPFQDLYIQKRTSAADAVRQVRDGDFIIVPTGVGEPPTLLTALSEQRRDFHDVKVAQILAIRKFAYIDAATADHVRHVAFFYGGATRAGGQAGWIDFIPNYFSDIPRLIERGQIPADVVFSMASPMDAHGYFSLSLGADYTMAAVAKARGRVESTNVPFASETVMCTSRRSQRWSKAASRCSKWGCRRSARCRKPSANMSPT
jgi:acyl-CoA hydrolase